MNRLKKVGILDDEKIAVDGLVHQLRKLLPEVDVQGFVQPQPFLEWCERELPGLVFLDMELPGIMGLEIAKKVRHCVGNIVFVTAHSEYSLDAFETAVDYILKPVTASRLKQSLEKISALKPVPVFEDFTVKIPIKGAFHHVSERDIIMLRGQRNYTDVVMVNGESHLVARTLKSFSEGLSDRFWRVHKSVIVRSDAVKEIKWSSRPVIVLDGDVTVEASKSRLDELGISA